MKEFVIKITHGEKNEKKTKYWDQARTFNRRKMEYIYFICVDYFHKIIIIELFVIKLGRGNKKYKYRMEIYIDGRVSPRWLHAMGECNADIYLLTKILIRKSYRYRNAIYHNDFDRHQLRFFFLQ